MNWDLPILSKRRASKSASVYGSREATPGPLPRDLNPTNNPHQATAAAAAAAAAAPSQSNKLDTGSSQNPGSAAQGSQGFFVSKKMLMQAVRRADKEARAAARAAAGLAAAGGLAAAAAGQLPAAGAQGGAADEAPAANADAAAGAGALADAAGNLQQEAADGGVAGMGGGDRAAEEAAHPVAAAEPAAAGVVAAADLEAAAGLQQVLVPAAEVAPTPLPPYYGYCAYLPRNTGPYMCITGEHAKSVKKLLGHPAEQPQQAAEQLGADADAAAAAADEAQHQPGGLRLGSWPVVVINTPEHFHIKQLLKTVPGKAFDADDKGLPAGTVWHHAMGLTLLVLAPQPCAATLQHEELWVSRRAFILRDTARLSTDQLTRFAAGKLQHHTFAAEELLADVLLSVTCEDAGSKYASVEAQQRQLAASMHGLTERSAQLLAAVAGVVMYECREGVPGGLEADWGVLPSLQCGKVPAARQPAPQKTGLTHQMAQL